MIADQIKSLIWQEPTPCQVGSFRTLSGAESMARTIRSSKILNGPLIPDHGHSTGAEFQDQESEVRFDQRKLFDRNSDRIPRRSIA